MTDARERERYWARRREARRANAKAARLCRRCCRIGHEKADCAVPLFVWTNGPDMIVAESADRVAFIWNQALLPEDFDLHTKAEDWRRVDEASLTLNGVTLAPSEWAALFGEGWLVVDGELVSPREGR